MEKNQQNFVICFLPPVVRMVKERPVELYKGPFTSAKDMADKVLAGEIHHELKSVYGGGRFYIGPEPQDYGSVHTTTWWGTDKDRSGPLKPFLLNLIGPY